MHGREKVNFAVGKICEILVVVVVVVVVVVIVAALITVSS